MIEILKKFELFQGLAPKTYNELNKRGKIKTFKPRSVLVEDRHVCEYVYFIISGAVSIYKYNANGQKKIFYMLNQGQFINEDISETMSSSIHAETHDECQIFMISKKDMLEIMEKDFELTKHIMYSLSSKIRRLYRQLKNTPHSIKIEKRVAAKLYKLAKDYGVEDTQGIRIGIQLSITYLADLLGSQRETVSRAVKVLQNAHLVYFKNRTFIIYDIEALSKYFKS